VSEGDRAACLAVIEQVRNNLELMKLSRSWRITAPLRWLHNQWNNIFEKLGFT